MVEVSPTAPVRAMELITILNRCHPLRGFVYQQAHFSADKKSIEVAVRPRKGSVAICSRCHLPAPGYDQLGERRFEFIPLWGFLVFLLYTIDAIGVDEIQYSKGHKYLTLVYQIDIGITRLLWVGKERTIQSFQGFFTTMGQEIVSKIVFICSDMWEPYLKVIREKCSEALHIRDRFHIVA